MNNTYLYILADKSEIQTKEEAIQKMNHTEIPTKNIYCDFIDIDKNKGSRKNLNNLLRTISEGDMLYISNFGDLGLRSEDILKNWTLITKERKADIALLESPIINTNLGKSIVGSYTSDIVVAVLKYYVEQRQKVHKKQKHGIEQARENGVQIGRKSNKLPENFAEICEMKLQGKITGREAAKLLDMPETTFRYRLKKYLSEKSNKK